MERRVSLEDVDADKAEPRECCAKHSTPTMLKKIEINQLRVGMHLHAFDGAWIDHPFWRSRFVITDAREIKLALASDLHECWIETTLGLDVVEANEPRSETQQTTSKPEANQVAPKLPSGSRPMSGPTSMDEELRHAAGIVRRGRQDVIAMFSDARLGRAIDADQCAPLVEEITNSVFRNPGALVSLARLKTKDNYSYMHSVAVCALMVSLARQLGLQDDECRQSGMAGLLHDIGKATIPEALLSKPGKLTDAEFEIMKSHPERGHAILLEARGASAQALEVCLHHHEKMDGSGYPHGLNEDTITLLARMGAVCDVYDAVTSNRPYRSGWDPGDAIMQMATWNGHFDPKVLAAFVRGVGIYPVGAIVRMESGRIGVVVDQSPARPSSPVVKIFFSTRSNLPMPPLRLDLASSRANDRIVGRESAERWASKQIEDLWIDPEVRRPDR